METRIHLTPREISEIAELYHKINESERDLLYSNNSSRSEKISAAKYLYEINIPEYKKLPEVIRNALRVDVERLEKMAKEFLESIGEHPRVLV